MEVKIDRLDSILRRFFDKHQGVLGTILLSLEGVNVNLSGNKDDLYALLKIFEKEGFNIITAKFNKIESHPFHKVKILVKKEICALKDYNLQAKINKVNGLKTDLYFSKKFDLVSNDKWDKLLMDENSLILDIRNDYEHVMGGFQGKNIVQPNVKNFHETISWIEDNKKLIEKYNKIGMYCTGGIRCEKLSFYLNEKGYKHISLLKGGIIQYINESSDKVKSEANGDKKIANWQGDCFVFDDRKFLQY